MELAWGPSALPCCFLAKPWGRDLSHSLIDIYLSFPVICKELKLLGPWSGEGWISFSHLDQAFQLAQIKALHQVPSREPKQFENLPSGEQWGNTGWAHWKTDTACLGERSICWGCLAVGYTMCQVLYEGRSEPGQTDLGMSAGTWCRCSARCCCLWTPSSNGRNSRKLRRGPQCNLFMGKIMRSVSYTKEEKLFSSLTTQDYRNCRCYNKPLLA